MSRMVGGTFGVAAVGALFQQHQRQPARTQRLGELPLSSQQQAWFADNLGSGAVEREAEAARPARPPRRSAARCKETFVHSLSASLKLSTAVAAVGRRDRAR